MRIAGTLQLVGDMEYDVAGTGVGGTDVPAERGTDVRAERTPQPTAERP